MEMADQIKFNILISYAQEDSPLVEGSLLDVLESAGVKVKV